MIYTYLAHAAPAAAQNVPIRSRRNADELDLSALIGRRRDAAVVCIHAILRPTTHAVHARHEFLAARMQIYSL